MDILLNGGVLMIGSLRWDPDEQRKDWINNNLQIDRQIIVQAPIRYGRISSGRNDTFTMVFSNECNQPDLLGKAVFVPFADNPLDLSNVVTQSIKLINAERKNAIINPRFFYWSWGTLTISINPNILVETSEKYSQAKLLLDFWSGKYDEEFNPEQYKVGQEPTILNNLGILNFIWTDELNDFDFIIATATIPVRVYPSSQDIADRMFANGYDEYFFKNRKFGISTFQDEEIARILLERRNQ